jgi:hypothetical protein
MASIESPSDLIAGSMDAIGGSLHSLSTSSGSSGGEESKLAYRRDLRVYTADFARGQSGTAEEFLRGVAHIGEDHGLINWEGDASTPLAIGEGLRDAGASDESLERLERELGAESPVSAQLRAGYRRAPD